MKCSMRSAAWAGLLVAAVGGCGESGHRPEDAAGDSGVSAPRVHAHGEAQGIPKRPWQDRAYRKFGKLGYGRPGSASDLALGTALLEAAHPGAVFVGAEASRAVEGQTLTAVITLSWRDAAGTARATTVRSTIAEGGHEGTSVEAPAEAPVRGERAQAVTAVMVRFWDDLRSRMGRNRSRPNRMRWIRTATDQMERKRLSRPGSPPAAAVGREILARIRPNAVHRETTIAPEPSGGSKLLLTISTVAVDAGAGTPGTTVVRVTLDADRVAGITLTAPGTQAVSDAQRAALAEYLTSFWGDFLLRMDERDHDPLAPAKLGGKR
ncbi:MAG: serine/threonine-protein kinase [Planctomycetota bacterium]|jgi:hypothetical protein